MRKERGLSQQQAAEVAGLTRQNWQQYEAGERQAILRSDQQAVLAGALGGTRDELLQRAGQGRQGRTVMPLSFSYTELSPGFSDDSPGAMPIRDTVQAGSWREADDADQTQTPTHFQARDRRYPYADQWLSRVAGDSATALGIFDGDLIHCVDAIGISYSPKTGDIVEVERLRFGGQLRELTVKQVEVTQAGILLWPRSHNPKWKDPVLLHEGEDEVEHVEVRLRGLVVGSIRTF